MTHLDAASRGRFAIGLSLLAVAICGLVGATAGTWARRPGPPAIAFRPVDPLTSCGPVSLALVGHWLGAPRPLDEWNRLTRTSEGGLSSLGGLREGARAAGLSAEAIRWDPRGPVPWDGPAILHIDGNHFVAALPVGRDAFVIADPPNPPKIVGHRALATQWDGVALVVSRSDAELRPRVAVPPQPPSRLRVE